MVKHDCTVLGNFPQSSMGNFPFEVGKCPKYNIQMHKSFSAAFIAHLDTTGAKVTDIARSSGVPKDALYSLKYGKSRNMGVEDAIRVAAAFGETVEEFMGLSPSQPSTGLSEQMAKLTAREQRLLEASLAAILADRDSLIAEEARDEAEAARPLGQSSD